MVSKIGGKVATSLRDAVLGDDDLASRSDAATSSITAFADMPKPVATDDSASSTSHNNTARFRAVSTGSDGNASTCFRTSGNAFVTSSSAARFCRASSSSCRTRSASASRRFSRCAAIVRCLALSRTMRKSPSWMSSAAVLCAGRWIMNCAKTTWPRSRSGSPPEGVTNFASDALHSRQPVKLSVTASATFM